MADTSGMDLASLISQATAQMGVIDTTTAKLQSNATGSADASAVLADALAHGTDANGETPLSLQVKLASQLETQQKNAEFYKAIGEDGQGQAKISSFLATAFQENTKRAMEQATDIQSRESVGLLDDPLAYMWNQIVLPDAKNGLDATLKSGEIIQTRMNELNKALDDHHKVEAEYATTITAASAESQWKGAQANIDARVQQAKIAAFHNDSQNMVEVMHADAQRTQLISNVLAARSNDAHLQLAREAAARDRERFQQWQTETKDTNEYQEQVYQDVKSQTDRMGLPEIPKREVVLALKGMSRSSTLAAQIQQLAMAGYINRNSGALGNRYGETASAGITFTTTTNTPIPAKLNDVFVDASATAGADAKLKGMDIHNKALMDVKLNDTINDKMKQYSDKIDPGDTTNPYNAPPLSVMAAQEGVKNSKLIQILGPQIAAGGLTSSNPRVIFAKGIEAVKSGDLTMGELGQNLLQFYTAAANANSIQNQFNRFGMKDQNTYYAAKLTPKALFGSTARFSDPNNPNPNLMNLVDINSVLVKMMVNDEAATTQLGM